MNAQLKELAYSAAYDAFYNANRQDRSNLNDQQIKTLNWLEGSMADSYARMMIKSGGNHKRSLAFVHKFYAVQNLKNIFQAIESGKSQEEILEVANF
jgi:vacuolar-type H+-ATPase subunit C/Vma6